MFLNDTIEVSFNELINKSEVLMKRNIIKIDEEKCNGCGLCIPSCHEGAIKLVDGKAKLAGDSLCDGLGACLGECPQGAIIIEEREADAYNEIEALENIIVKSELQQWPVQLRLLNPRAPFFQDAHLVVSSDCVPFTYADFHRKFLKDKALVVFCPKLDENLEEYIEKLTEILKVNTIRSVTILRMEVPCCGATVNIVEEAVRRSGKGVILKEMTISRHGEIMA